MNWKKVILFVFLLLVGLVLFGFPPLYVSLFQPIFFIAYVVFLSLIIFKEYSRKKLIILIVIFVVYLAIMLIPFPKCDSWGKWGGESQTCTCIGIKKHSFGVYDASWSQCVGLPTNYKTTTLEQQITQQIEQQIFNDLEDPNKKISFPTSQITIEKEQTQQSVFGVKNVNNLPLTFSIKTEVRNQEGIIDNSMLQLETTSPTTLGPLEKATYNLIIKAPNKVDTFLVKLMIIDQQSPELVYAEKSFFVQVVE